MMHPQQMKDLMGILLLLGTLFSAGLVFLGGVLYLMHHGSDPIPVRFLTEVWHFDFSFSPLGIIEMGLLSLVVLQILRIILLFGFYLAIRDYWFSLFSSFILLVLVYSVFCRT